MATHKIKKYSFILLVITFSSIATINTNFSSLNNFKLNLFIGKFRFIVASILTTWIFEVLIMQLFDISGFIFIFIFLLSYSCN